MEKLWWNQNKIEWYERASIYSSFHSSLSLILETYIKKSESILELGCGLGYCAEIMSRDGYDIKALDIDQRVIERARERSGLDIFSVSNYRDSSEKRDVVMTLFFGRLWVDDNLSYLLRHGDKLISVHSLHSGQKGVERNRYTPSLSSSLSFLLSKGYKARGEEITIPFPQPLSSMEEAEEYIRQCYPGRSLSQYEGNIRETGDEEYPLLFHNDKRMVILEIEKP